VDDQVGKSLGYGRCIPRTSEIRDIEYQTIATKLLRQKG
jgi:hypothetical protein